MKYSIQQIRNFCIIAHVDHGKSTLADWLLSQAKIISEKPGRRYLDTRADEQKRGITIVSASITFTLNNHTFNLIDSPGHVDFGGNVTKALRACDGALLLIDAVEGIMPQTHAVLKQALKENVVPVLMINKIDRLFKELNLDNEAIKKKLANLISSINLLVESISKHSAIKPFSLKTGNIILGSGLEGWAINPSIGNLSLSHVLDHYKRGEGSELKRIMPLADIVTTTIINHIPNPEQAQTYKLEKIGSHISEEYMQPLKECNPYSKLVGVVTSICYTRERGKLVSVRLFAGMAKKGMIVYSSEKKNEPMTISRTGLFMGKNFEELDEIPAGMIVVMSGLGDVLLGTTISEDPHFPSFDAIKHSTDPVMSVSFTPIKQSDLAKLKDIMQQEVIQDMTLKYEYDPDTREHILKGLGKLHIEVVLNRVMTEEKIELKIKPPTVIYMETILESSPILETITSNRLNKFKISVQALSSTVIELLNDTTDLLKHPKHKQMLMESGLDSNLAKKVVAVEGTNLLINHTKSVQFMQETVPNVILGFKKAMTNGPVMKKMVTGVCVLLEDANWHVDFVHRTPQDIAPPTTKLIYECMNLAKPKVLQPFIDTFITVPIEYIGAINREIQVHKGRVGVSQYEEDTVTVTGHIPVKNSFDLSESLMSASEGRVNWRYELGVYELLPDDELEEVKKENKIVE
jgi:elongation factor 2